MSDSQLRKKDSLAFLKSQGYTGSGGGSPDKSRISLWIGEFDNSGSNSDLNEAAAALAQIATQATNIANYVPNVLKYGAQRAADHGRAVAVKEIQEDYMVQSTAFKKATKSSSHINADVGGNVESFVEFQGVHIPLARFDTTIDKSGRVYAKVKRQSAKQLLEHAFKAKFGTNGNQKAYKYGIYERKYKSRFPIRQLWGASAAQMMWSNLGLRNRIGKEMKAMFESRVKHELMARLNGWTD